MTITIQTVYEERREHVEWLRSELQKQGVRVRFTLARADETARETFHRALHASITGGYALLLQDDVIPAPDFADRLRAYLGRGYEMLSGYSNSKHDLQEGDARRVSPSSFYNLQCLALQSHHVAPILDFAPSWYVATKHEKSFDRMIAAYCSENRVPIHVATPSLVQHGDLPSLMEHDYGRRRSRSFTKAYPDVCPYG